MLLSTWRKFKGWAVLEFFLEHDVDIHLKGLARRLRISPGTAELYLKLYENEGILQNERVGNVFLYRLNANFTTMELKRAYAILKFGKYFSGFLKNNVNIASFVLYGSYAEGSYDTNSDLDLLVISQNKDLDTSYLKKLETDVGKEVKIEVFSPGEWRAMERRQNNFYNSVIKSSVLLHGARI